MHSSGTGCILISDSKTGTVCRLYFYTSCILAADFIAVHGISPSSQLTLVNFQVRQGYCYRLSNNSHVLCPVCVTTVQECVIHVLNSEVQHDINCRNLLTHRDYGQWPTHIDHNPLWHRIVPCAMFNVHCVHILCKFNVHCIHTLCNLQSSLCSHFVYSQ